MKKALVILFVLGILLINVPSVSAKYSDMPMLMKEATDYYRDGIDYIWIQEINTETRFVRICYPVLWETYCLAPMYVSEDATLRVAGVNGPVELGDLPMYPPYYIKFLVKDEVIVHITVIDYTNMY